MNNPAFDIPEREMLIIIDSNAESTCPEVNWAECEAQVNALFKNAYSETKCFIARAKVRFSQHMRSISRTVLQCFSSPRLQSKTVLQDLAVAIALHGAAAAQPNLVIVTVPPRTPYLFITYL